MASKKRPPANLDEWALEGSDRPPRRRRPPTIAATVFELAREEALERIASGEWEGAEPRHFVAAYALAHERVYGFAPAELTPTTRARATFLAARLLRDVFANDGVRMAEYVRWVWSREAQREKWRRENGRSGGRIGFALMFGTRMIDDWRLDAARRRGHSGGRCAGDAGS